MGDQLLRDWISASDSLKLPQICISTYSLTFLAKITPSLVGKTLENRLESIGFEGPSAGFDKPLICFLMPSKRFDGPAEILDRLRCGGRPRDERAPASAPGRGNGGK